MAGGLPAWLVGGRVVVIGVGAGAKVELNLLALMASRATIGGSMLRSRTIDGEGGGGPLGGGRRGPTAGRRIAHGAGGRALPMAEADRAYERFAAGGKFGKIVLVNG